MIRPEAHAMFASQFMTTLISSMVHSDMMTAQQAHQLIDMTLADQTRLNGALASDFAQIADLYRHGVQAAEQARG